MNDNKGIILRVNNVSKKFPTSLKANMVYGIWDFFRILFNLSLNSSVLRKDEFWALKDISFELRENEILAIVGINGSGKTTLMRIISGIYSADSGDILFPKKKKITSLFALSTGMHPLFTGRENIYIKGSMFGMTKTEIEKQMDFIIDFSELEEFMDRPFGSYSSGMRARLAFAIALATDPELLILDEALAVGDFIFRSKCFNYLEDLVKQPNKSVLIVTNNPRKVRNMATRMIIIQKGKQIYETLNVEEGMKYFIMNCVEGMEASQKKKYLRNIKKFES